MSRACRVAERHMWPFIPSVSREDKQYLYLWKKLAREEKKERNKWNVQGRVSWRPRGFSFLGDTTTKCEEYRLGHGGLQQMSERICTLYESLSVHNYTSYQCYQIIQLVNP